MRIRLYFWFDSNFFQNHKKHFHFAKSIRFWRDVENIKNEPPASRPTKIQNGLFRKTQIKDDNFLVVVKYFAKGPKGVSLGSDATIFNDLSVYPPDKVTVSMLITAQVIIQFESYFLPVNFLRQIKVLI